VALSECRPERDRWYVDASWKATARQSVPLAGLRQSPVLAIDLDAGHHAGAVVDPTASAVGTRSGSLCNWPP